MGFMDVKLLRVMFDFVRSIFQPKIGGGEGGGRVYF